jgi:hypothetical protein
VRVRPRCSSNKLGHRRGVGECGPVFEGIVQRLGQPLVSSIQICRSAMIRATTLCRCVDR